MSVANHQVARTRAQTPARDECAPFTAIRTAIENLSDDQVRGLIGALVGGLVHGMIEDVAARADDIVDEVVENIAAQLSTAAHALPQPARVSAARQQDAVKRACELCGRIGSRRFVESATGWRCAPSATKCVGHRRAPSGVDARLVATASKRSTPEVDRALKIVRTPGVTARCQDCTRTWTLTGPVLQAAIDQHELKRGHLITIYDEQANELVEACQ